MTRSRSHPDHERRVVPQSEESQSKPMQDVDHPGDPSDLPKGNDSLTSSVAHLLVIDQTNILEGRQSRIVSRVARLGLG